MNRKNYHDKPLNSITQQIRDVLRKHPGIPAKDLAKRLALYKFSTLGIQSALASCEGRILIAEDDYGGLWLMEDM